MRIAFDVMGTIKGPKAHIILRLFEELQKRGHECVVWSSLYSYAVDAIKDNDLQNTQPMDKMSKFDLAERGMPEFDWAIDDDRSSGRYLGAKQFIYVDEIETLGWCFVKMGIPE